MKETNWGDCLENASAKRVTPDVSRAESLRETAEERISLKKTLKSSYQ